MKIEFKVSHPAADFHFETDEVVSIEEAQAWVLEQLDVVNDVMEVFAEDEPEQGTAICNWCGEPNDLEDLSRPHRFEKQEGLMCRDCWATDRVIYRGRGEGDIGLFIPVGPEAPEAP